MYEYKVIIDRWVDGDTVDVDIDLGFDVVLKKQRVRLYGIDAWESRTRDLEEKEKGLAAKEFCKNFAKEGEPAILKTKTYDASGKYGRILGRFGLLASSVINLSMSILLKKVMQNLISVGRDSEVYHSTTLDR